VTVAVLDVGSIAPAAEGAASVRPFLNGVTVGARVVEGLAYELPPGARLRADAPPDRHQALYVTSGRVRALHAGERHDLRPGCGVYCEPGEACELENSGGEAAAFYRFLVARS
jgi:quercetin dioxygenase-like cupin family protein